MASPWLQVKLLRILSYYPNWYVSVSHFVLLGFVSRRLFLHYSPDLFFSAADEGYRTKLTDILKRILKSAEGYPASAGPTPNHKNALLAVLFEAIDLIIKMDDDRELLRTSVTLLGRFLSSKET